MWTFLICGVGQVSMRLKHTSQYRAAHHPTTEHTHVLLPQQRAYYHRSRCVRQGLLYLIDFSGRAERHFNYAARCVRHTSSADAGTQWCNPATAAKVWAVAVSAVARALWLTFAAALRAVWRHVVRGRAPWARTLGAILPAVPRSRDPMRRAPRDFSCASPSDFP